MLLFVVFFGGLSVEDDVMNNWLLLAEALVNEDLRKILVEVGPHANVPVNDDVIRRKAASRDKYIMIFYL